MRVMNRADNTSDKNPTTMTMKGIRGRLVRILATGSDVMCGCSEQEGKLVLRKKVMSVVQIIHDTASLSWRVRAMHLIRVVEHLGASSRRHRHPALDVQVDGVRKMPVKRAKSHILTATAIK